MAELTSACGLLQVELGGVVVLGELLGGGLELVDAGGECVRLLLLVLDGVSGGHPVRERAGAEHDGDCRSRHGAGASGGTLTIR